MRVEQIGNSESPSRGAGPRWRSAASRGGFTLLELLVVVGIILILISLILATLRHARADAQSIACLNNLRQIHDAFNAYAMENNNYFPVPQFPGQSWESMLEKYVGGHEELFRCPADTEIWQSVGSSYDWRSQFDKNSSLSGKRRIDALRGNAVMAFETLPSWHDLHMFNVVRIDGSAGPMYEDAFGQDVMTPVMIHN